MHEEPQLTSMLSFVLVTWLQGPDGDNGSDGTPGTPGLPGADVS